MKEFILLSLLFTVSIGWFFGLMFSSGISDKKPIKRTIVGVITALLVGCVLSGGITLEKHRNEKIWNNGRCNDCNIEWSLVNIQHSAKIGGTTYYYQCENCKKIIEIHK